MTKTDVLDDMEEDDEFEALDQRREISLKDDSKQPTKYVGMKNAFILSYCHCNPITFATAFVVTEKAWFAFCGLLPRTDTFVALTFTDVMTENTIIMDTAASVSPFLQSLAKKISRAIVKGHQKFISVTRILF